MPARRTAAPLAGLYFLYYAVVGVTLPFFPAYFQGLGLSATEIGVLLALTPLFGLLAPPFAGRLADCTGQPVTVLRAVMFGAALGFVPLLVARSFFGLALGIAAWAAFASCIVPLLDALTLRHVASEGGSYAHLRVFGSIGFVATAFLFGLSSRHVGPAAVELCFVLIALGAAMSWRVVPEPARKVSVPPLVPTRELFLFVLATCLHWIACAPYHGTFALLVGAHGLAPWVVGSSASLGVVAEIAVMAAYPRLFSRLPPRRVMAVAFLASAARWVLTGQATTPLGFLGLSLIHGLTFGAFYVAAVSFLARRVSDERRASGQALFAAITFGLGGLIGFLTAGALYDTYGGPRLFTLAGALELVPFAIALCLPAPASETQAA